MIFQGRVSIIVDNKSVAPKEATPRQQNVCHCSEKLDEDKHQVSFRGKLELKDASGRR